MTGILKKIITFISSFVFLITLMCLIVILNISYFFTAENITNGVLKMDISKALHEVENADISSNEITEVLDNAYIVAEHYGVSSDVIDEMVEDKAVKEFFGIIAGNVTDYIINGKDRKALTSEDFNQILDNNIDNWIEKSNVKVTEKQKEDFLKTVKSQSGQIIDNLPNASTVAEKLEVSNLDSLKIIFDSKTKIVLSTLLIISLILLIILKRSKFIMYLGYTTLITGIITIGIGLISNDLITMILMKSDIFLDVSLFGNMLTNQFVITGIILIVIALLSYIIHLFIKRKAH